GPGGSATIQNFYDQSTARGVSSYDVTHFLSWATLYELPFGHGKKWLRSGPGSWILGNLQANFIAQTRNGAPFNPVVMGDLANRREVQDAVPGGGVQRIQYSKLGHACEREPYD